MSIAIDAIILTRTCFAWLLFGKTAVCAAIFVRVYRELGWKNIQVFSADYLKSQNILAAAWRLGAYASLLFT